MEVIIIQSDAYQKLKQDIIDELRILVYAIIAQYNKGDPNEIVWLKPAEARALLGLKSRNTWKKLCANGSVHYLKMGREFQYDKQSLLDYMLSKSTLKFTINANKKKK